MRGLWGTYGEEIYSVEALAGLDCDGGHFAEKGDFGRDKARGQCESHTLWQTLKLQCRPSRWG